MININLVRQYLFCPRIVYFNLFTNIKPVYPKQVSFGVEYHFLQEKLSKNRKFKKLNIQYNEVILDKFFESEKYGIQGKVDIAFISKDEVVPMEFKNILKKPSFSYIMQVVGYGLLLEENYNKDFKRGFVIYGNNLKFYSFFMDDRLKSKFFNIISEIKNIENNGLFPNSSASDNKCLQCEYLNFCDDRF